MKNKKILIVCLIIIILASVITNIYIFSNKKEPEPAKIDGIDTAKNQEILKDATVEGLSVTNISLLTIDGISTYKAEVTNTTDSDLSIDNMYVVFYEDDYQQKSLVLYDVVLKPGDTTNIKIVSDNDLSKSTDIKYILEKNAEK